MTRFDDFWKFSATNFSLIISPMFDDILGNFESHHFLSSTAVAAFWATFEKIKAYFYSNIWSH